MFTSNMSNATARQSRHKNYISNFTSDIQYIQGKQNVTADCLSRPIEDQINVIFEEQSPLNYQKLAEAPDSNPSISLLQQSDNSLQISTQKLPKSTEPSCSIPPPVLHDPWCQLLFAEKCLTYCIVWRTQVLSLLKNSFRNALFGQKFTLMSETGPEIVSRAKGQKFTDTTLPPYRSIPLLMNASPTFT